MKTYTLLVFAFFALAANSQALPENAQPNIYGNGWVCKSGFKQMGSGCVKVDIPTNATLNIYGNGWVCNSGFKQMGSGCVKVDIPANATLNIYGNGWVCNSSFKQMGSGCVKVDIPTNAGLNIYGNGWVCNSGFKQMGSGCVKVDIPTNATLNIYGNGWVCKKGFKQLSGACLAMSSEEIKQMEVREKAILTAIAARKAALAIGNSCETESRTGAEVCITINNVRFDCDKNSFGNYYTSCEIVIDYDLQTNFKGRGYLDVEVECKAEIEYSGKNSYSNQSDSQRKNESSSLYANGSDSESIRLDFSFSSYEEVRKARISSHSCEIENISLY
jgi:hypothetical protein